MSTTQILYDGNRLIPAINISYGRNFISNDDGTIIGQVYNIVFSSKIMAYMGSPTSSGTFWTSNDYPPDETVLSNARLSSILNKQKAIRNLFAKDNIGKKFEIIPEDSGATYYFFPDSISLSFAEGSWFNDCDYTITMTANRIYPDLPVFSGYAISSASESWSIEPNEQSLGYDVPFTYRVSHSLSAAGQRTYISGVSNTPINEAKNWVKDRLGIEYTILSGVNMISGLGAYNHVVTEQIDTTSASYSVNETWLFSSGNVIEDYNVSTQGSIDGFTRVNIDGNITGLELRNLDNITEYKWSNASGYFASIQNSLLSRAQNISQISLNPISLSNTIGRNPLQGTISYNYEYDNRPTSLISGARSERIVVSYGEESQKFAAIPVIGRGARGSVKQSLGFSDDKTKSLSIDFSLGAYSGVSLSASDFTFPYSRVSGLVDLLDPYNNGAIKSFKSQPQASWEPLTGIGSYNIDWTYE